MLGHSDQLMLKLYRLLDQWFLLCDLPWLVTFKLSLLNLYGLYVRFEEPTICLCNKSLRWYHFQLRHDCNLWCWCKSRWKWTEISNNSLEWKSSTYAMYAMYVESPPLCPPDTFSWKNWLWLCYDLPGVTRELGGETIWLMKEMGFELGLA